MRSPRSSHVEAALTHCTQDPLIQLQDKLQRLERDKVKFQAYLKTLSDQIATRKSSILKVLADKELARSSRPPPLPPTPTDPFPQSRKVKPVF